MVPGEKILSIGILDIGIGNIGSVYNVVFNQGWDPILISSHSDFSKITHLIIPGVGSYFSAIEKLNKKKLIDPIYEFANKGNPILGICIGMQILNDTGVEGGATNGLGLIPGATLPLKKVEGLSLPHIGWNEVIHHKDHPILRDIKPNIDFYFVNSYYFQATSDINVISYANYGQEFSAIVSKSNIVGVQFHPEKSQLNGLKMIDNFCLWDGKC